MGAFPPTTQRIAGSRHKPIGVVHILVTSQPAEYRLPQQPDQQVASVPAGARLCQSLAAACGQCEHVVQLAIRQQSAIGGDRRAVEPEHHSPVEIEPQRPAVRFTRRVRHGYPVRSLSTCCSLYAYTIIRHIAPQNTVPSGECGLKRKEHAAAVHIASADRYQ